MATIVTDKLFWIFFSYIATGELICFLYLASTHWLQRIHSPIKIAWICGLWIRDLIRNHSHDSSEFESTKYVVRSKYTMNAFKPSDLNVNSFPISSVHFSEWDMTSLWWNFRNVFVTAFQSASPSAGFFLIQSDQPSVNVSFDQGE